MNTLAELEQMIALTPDFPKEGVVFRDISPLLSQRFNDVIDVFSNVFTVSEIKHVDAFAGIDARGFIFASALAARHGKNMLMIRKGGKLPPPSLQASYSLEYGSSVLELKPGAGGKVIVLDDVLATGGTLAAGADLCTKAGYEVMALAALLDLRFLNDFSWNGMRARSVWAYT